VLSIQLHTMFLNVIYLRKLYETNSKNRKRLLYAFDGGDATPNIIQEFQFSIRFDVRIFRIDRNSFDCRFQEYQTQRKNS
jgi:hypothetical protein